VNPPTELVQVWIAYAGVALLMSLTPGPAVLFVVGQGVWRGPFAALKANAAINLVNTVNIGLAGLGLAAIFSLSQAVFTTLKLIGAVYLIWLGVRAIRGSFRSDAALEEAGPGRPFVDGLIVQASNPKAFLFVGAILPQFILPAHPIAPQILVIWALSLITEFGVLGGYGLLAGFVRRSANLPSMRAWLERGGGGILIVVGIMTALYRKA
jgi:homoserine/homoserine lactone efflux protein